MLGINDHPESVDERIVCGSNTRQWAAPKVYVPIVALPARHRYLNFVLDPFQVLIHLAEFYETGGLSGSVVGAVSGDGPSTLFCWSKLTFSDDKMKSFLDIGLLNL